MGSLEGRVGEEADTEGGGRQQQRRQLVERESFPLEAPRDPRERRASPRNRMAAPLRRSMQGEPGAWSRVGVFSHPVCWVIQHE